MARDKRCSLCRLRLHSKSSSSHSSGKQQQYKKSRGLTKVSSLDALRLPQDPYHLSWLLWSPFNFLGTILLHWSDRTQPQNLNYLHCHWIYRSTGTTSLIYGTPGNNISGVPDSNLWPGLVFKRCVQHLRMRHNTTPLGPMAPYRLPGADLQSTTCLGLTLIP